MKRQLDSAVTKFDSTVHIIRQLCILPLFLLCVSFLVGCDADPTPVAVATTLPPPTATSSPTVTPTPVPTHTPSPSPTPTTTPTPTASPTPTPLPGASYIAFESYRNGDGEVYLLDTRTGRLTNLTRHPAEDRAPAWRPDGRAIAFESRRDGNWDIYVLDLASGHLTRLTEHPAYDGAPAWSPDGSAIAFESYRDGDLEIYVVAASGGQLRRLTQDPGGDYGPAWSPDGAHIAFTSWRGGNKEVCVIPEGGGEVLNLTENPADDEDPVWSPDGSALAFVSWRDVDPGTGNRNAEIYRVDMAGGKIERLTDNPWPDLDPAWDVEGRLIWTAYDPGEPFEAYDPYRPGDFHLYLAGEGEDTGLRAPQRLTNTNWDDRRPAPAPPQVADLERLAQLLPAEPLALTPQPTLSPDQRVEVVQVSSILASYSGQPIRVNERVAPSLVAWQRDLLEASGHDFLHLTLGAWRNIDQVRKREMYAYDYGYLSWHKAGRALDLALELKVDGVNHMVLVREDLGGQTYWRMYLRTALQDGSQGEPLKDNPWLYWWHIVPEHEPEAYDAGGKRQPIPSGYYVDVTALAKRHGWERIASYDIVGDYHWHVDSNGTEYWHYERTDGLIWWEAMAQLYPPETLEEYVGWGASSSKAQSEEMMRSKGIPHPAP